MSDSWLGISIRPNRCWKNWPSAILDGSKRQTNNEIILYGFLFWVNRLSLFQCRSHALFSTAFAVKFAVVYGTLVYFPKKQQQYVTCKLIYYLSINVSTFISQASRISSAAGSRRASVSDEAAVVQASASASSGVSSGGSSGDEAPPPPPPPPAPPAPPAPPHKVLEEPALRPSELRGRLGKSSWSS